MNTGQPALAYLRYIIAGELAGAWAEFGGLGAMLANLASVMELPVLQNMETACRFERAQNAAWTHLARERGSLQIIRDELVEVNRDRLEQVVNGQISEFNDRHKKRGGGNPGSSNRPRARNNRRSRSPRRSPRWAKRSSRRREYQPRSSRDPKDTKCAKYNNSSEKKQDDENPEPKKGKKTSSDFA